MDTVSRFGGDEFVILLTQLDVNFEIARSQAAIVAEKIRASLSQPYILDIGKDAQIRTPIEHASSASIGVFVYLGNSDTIINLLKWSDAAMYLAKESGRNAVRFHLQRKE
jgi:diguanylate cyclase (GGDEF)-like protein